MLRIDQPHDYVSFNMAKLLSTSALMVYSLALLLVALQLQMWKSLAVTYQMVGSSISSSSMLISSLSNFSRVRVLSSASKLWIILILNSLLKEQRKKECVRSSMELDGHNLHMLDVAGDILWSLSLVGKRSWTSL